MEKKNPFQSIVFAGGGSRCLWQAGFWQVARPALDLKPEVIAGVSAGSTMACMCIGDRILEGLNFFKKITGENKKNFYFSKFSAAMPLFPSMQCTEVRSWKLLPKRPSKKSKMVPK